MKSFLDEENLLIGCMHEIMFARVSLEAVGVLQSLQFLLCAFCSCAVHIPLFLQMTNLPTPFDELDHTLVAHEDEHHQKQRQGKDILTPFLYFYRCQKLREGHNYKISLQRYYKLFKCTRI